MSRSRAAVRVLLAAFAAWPLARLPAAAGEMPAPAGPDPRVRVIAYDPQQVVKLYAVPGATLTIQLAPGEAVAGLPVSDQALLDGPEPEGPSGPLALVGGPSERVAAGRGATTDRNLFTAVRGNFVMLKPLRDLDPQPLFIIGRHTDPSTGREVMRAYTFELSTRNGPLTADAPNTYYLVRFTYPADERAAAEASRQAKAAAAVAAYKQRAERQARERLRVAQTTAEAANWNYYGQGDRELAPAEVWDDGQSTFLRFPGNRRIPAIFSVLPDGREAAVNYSADARGLVTVHQTGPALRLRDGDLVLCILNRAVDASGRNPGTGTTSADVVREIRR